jgi:GMP synthase-like glutamine amidotransferase
VRAHILQHAPSEGPGFIEQWLAERGAEVTRTHFWESPELPDPRSLDLLIVLGGPMSANDDAEYPWLAAEKRLIAEAVAAEVPVLGICLGAQLVAAALGARVYRGQQPEIGWFPVTAAPAQPDMFRFPEALDVFHWHGDTFDLPEGAVLLASSELTPHQGFQLGRRTIALQCHPEMTPAVVEALIETCGEQLVPARFIQSAEQLRAVPEGTYRAANAVMASVLDYLTEGR